MHVMSKKNCRNVSKLPVLWSIKLNVFSYLIIIINDAVMLLLKCGWSFVLCSHLFPLLSSLLRICLIFSPTFFFYDQENWSANFIFYDLLMFDGRVDLIRSLNLWHQHHKSESLIFSTQNWKKKINLE